jgi:hypothetical protein
VIEAPPPDDVAITYQPEELSELNLLRAGVSTVIWATGYDLDYGWIDAPILDELGYPRNVRGVAAVPRLYFLGLLWQHSQASASSSGLSTAHSSSKRWPVTRRFVVREAEHVAGSDRPRSRSRGVDHSRDERRKKAAQRSS